MSLIILCEGSLRAGALKRVKKEITDFATCQRIKALSHDLSELMVPFNIHLFFVLLVVLLVAPT